MMERVLQHQKGRWFSLTWIQTNHLGKEQSDFRPGLGAPAIPEDMQHMEVVKRSKSVPMEIVIIQPKVRRRSYIMHRSMGWRMDLRKTITMENEDRERVQWLKGGSGDGFWFGITIVMD